MPQRLPGFDELCAASRAGLLLAKLTFGQVKPFRAALGRPASGGSDTVPGHVAKPNLRTAIGELDLGAEIMEAIHKFSDKRCADHLSVTGKNR